MEKISPNMEEKSRTKLLGKTEFDLRMFAEGKSKNIDNQSLYLHSSLNFRLTCLKSVKDQSSRLMDTLVR